MEATDKIDGNDMDAVANSLLMPQEAQDNDNPQTEEAEAEEAPVEEQQTDEDEVETEEADDADAEGEEDGDEDDDDAEEAGQEGPETVTVKVDGEEVEVTLDDLKRSYSGQAYIQKGMQEAAQQKKQAEAVYQALTQEREQLARLWQAAQEGQLQSPPTPPSRELLNTDPIAYMEQRAAYEEAKEAYDKQASQFSKLSQQQTEAQKRAQQAYLQEQQRLLVERIPELADETKAPKVRAAIRETGAAYGYSDEELSSVMDARAVEVLHDAMKYRQMQQGKAKVQEKAKKARPVVKPGAKQTEAVGKKKAEQQARARMRKTGSIDDVANFLIQRK